jgi:predicted nucleotidyltransferase
MDHVQIKLPQEAIAAFCRRHHIRRLALFGSVTRPDFRPDSDVDVLVEFEPGNTPGLAFFRMQEELAMLLGRRVDLNTPEFLGHRFRDAVMREAETLYAGA